MPTVKVLVAGDDKPSEVTIEGCEYGVEFDDGFVVTCEDDKEARSTAEMTGGTFVARDVYVSAWAEVIE